MMNKGLKANSYKRSFAKITRNKTLHIKTKKKYKVETFSLNFSLIKKKLKLVDLDQKQVKKN